MSENSFFISISMLRDIDNVKETVLFLRILEASAQTEDGTVRIGIPERQAMCAELDVANFATVNRMLCDLVEKGYLARTKRGVYTIPEEKRVPVAAEAGIPF